MLRFATIALLCLFLAPVSRAADRVYYLAINDVIWDYAPTDLNLLTGNRLTYEKIANIYSGMFIGKKYKKAVYRRYTDGSFTTEVPHDPNLGFMGPTIQAEVGDRIIVHLFNNASRNYSAHPHGVFYTKANEGAMYNDNTANTSGDSVPPGGRYTYVWHARPDFGPAPDDPNCMTWTYHSHVDSSRDVHTGLIGALIVCRPGTYDKNMKRRDVDHEFVAMFFIDHEKMSWYFKDNMEMFMPGANPDVVKDSLFQKGNKMHTVNGLMFGNTPGYQVCQGDTISWQIIGMGSNRDLHPIQFQGQTVSHHRHRKDSFIMIPATFVTAIMNADNPGRWIIACKLYSHYTEGMNALLEVDAGCKKPSSSSPTTGLSGKVREYFITAEEVMWDYGPSGFNQLTEEVLNASGTHSATYFARSSNKIGGVYKKAVFRGYKTSAFAEPTPRTDDMGIIGPVISAEVGDTVKVLFKNTAAKHAFNIEPHGIYFTESDATMPGQKHTYTWTLPDSVSPGSNDPDCITYLYTSALEYIADSNAGLIGPLVVCKRGTLKKEMAKRNRYLLATVFEENKSWYFEENMKMFVPTAGKKIPTEPNQMHSINGRLFGNLFGVDVCVDEDTTFHLVAVGTKFDIHAIKFDGVNVKINGVSTGAINLFAHTSQTVTVRAEQTGAGVLFCSLMDHIKAGLFTIFEAKTCNNESPAMIKDSTTTINSAAKGTVRRYYMAAEEVMWNYNPSGKNTMGDSVNVVGNYGYEHLHRIPGKTIGSVYKKVLYIGYTDDTFTVRTPTPEHMGILGPAIRAEVGDTIHVTFWNKANRPYNMHPWGAFDAAYTIHNHSVAPGEVKEYQWKVPESASPTGKQPSCLSFIYVSSVDRAADVADGLMGPLVVCRPGKIDNAEIDKEFFLQFYIVDENLSHYLDDNIRLYIGTDPSSFNKKNGAFVESNKMMAINGFLFHVGGLQMLQDDIVRWHLIGWGNEKDYHSVHFHANTFKLITDGSYRGDVFDVFPGFFGTMDMRTVAVGEWLLHCHVFQHVRLGMETVYTVAPREMTSALFDEARKARKKYDVCDLTEVAGKRACVCGNMRLRRSSGLIGPGPAVRVRQPNGSVSTIDPAQISHLDLSGNRLNFFEARGILRAFPNLRSVDLSGNRVRFVTGSLVANNEHLKALIMRDMPSLFYVSPSLVAGNAARGTPSHDFSLLDLSDNRRLNPACLRHVFYNMKEFTNCLKP